VDLQIRASGLSDVGLKREGNEDAFSTEDSLGLYVVADGMGGHLAGEVASQIAVEMINKGIRRLIHEKTPLEEIFGTSDNSLSLEGNYILSTIRLANRVVYEMAIEKDKCHGMGTTVVMIYVTPTLVIAANVGDSPLYMIRNGSIERLSRDHTIVAEQIEMGMMTEEEAETSPLRNVLTRNLGSSETVEPDIFEIEPSLNDRFVLCSDGLSDLVSQEEILTMTQEENDPETLCRKFIDKALQRGAHDNTTVVTVFLTDMEKLRGGPARRIGLFFANLLTGVQKTIKK
jgi:protein phosphatase